MKQWHLLCFEGGANAILFHGLYYHYTDSIFFFSYISSILNEPIRTLCNAVVYTPIHA